MLFEIIGLESVVPAFANEVIFQCMHACSNFKHAIPTFGAQVKDEGKSCGVFLTVNKDLLTGVYLALTMHLQAVPIYLCSNHYCDFGLFTSHPTRYNL